jgi:hypothetical protein
VKKYIFLFCFLIVTIFSFSQQRNNVLDEIKAILNKPPESAKPWVFWYWINGCVNRTAVTADLEAMKRIGLGGAYLMFIRDTTARIDFQPQLRQLTPEWFAMVSHAIKEAKRLHLKLGLHFSDGFALAGGPWIKPEQSMQKLVWSKTIFDKNNSTIPQPETNFEYYKDIKTFAYQLNYKPTNSKLISVTDNVGKNLFFLTQKDSSNTYRCDTNCFINFNFDNNFTLRQIQIKKQNNAYQAQRFIIQASNDGVNYFSIDTLVPPLHGWQDNGVGYTHAVNNYTSKYFRLLWSKVGSEAGSESLDAAKWKPVLRVQGIYLSEVPTINNIEAKNGMIWRKANLTSKNELNEQNIVNENNIIDVSSYMKNNQLHWQPNNNATYMIVRIGHTSTGQTNETAGGGKGLECDKLSAKSVTWQYNNWFKNIFQKTNAKNVVNTLHIDSWECGSQNWTNNFEEQFFKINKYQLNKFLLTVTGVPVGSIQQSEKVLYDIRNTIATLMQTEFFGTIKKLAKKDNLQVSAESTAPTFVSDGLAHYQYVDIPMGEFWHNSPTHDKPNDMADAINAANIYGKKIIGAEAFTTLRMDWSENPMTLKQLGDWAFAQGVNKLFIHVWAHNPFLNKKPGITLDGIGLYYQRDQTWFEQSKAWIEYLTKTQALLQLGKPVAELAVYVGDNKPIRSILPNQLIKDFPNLFSKTYIENEKQRLLNENQPLAIMPDGVTHAANTLKAPIMLNAIGNYKYDCINSDILKKAKVKNGKLVLPNGNKYAALLIPSDMYSMFRNDEIVNQFKYLKTAGAIIIESENNKLEMKSTVNLDNENIAFLKKELPYGEIFYFSNASSLPQIANLKIHSKYNSISELSFLREVQSFDIVEKGKDGFNFEFKFNGNESVAFVLFNTNKLLMLNARKFFPLTDTLLINNWNVNYISANSSIIDSIDNLESWTKSTNNVIKYYSGTAIYSSTFEVSIKMITNYVNLIFENIHDIATVKINGKTVGTLWTKPYQLNIASALQIGINTIEIEVSNTWHNNLIGKDELPNLFPNIYTNAPYRLKSKLLLPSGIIGKVKIAY